MVQTILEVDDGLPGSLDDSSIAPIFPYASQASVLTKSVWMNINLV